LASQGIMYASSLNNNDFSNSSAGKSSNNTSSGGSKTSQGSSSGGGSGSGNNAPKPKNKPKASGEPNSVEYQRDANGNINKYTEFGPNGEFVKEVRITGKDHGNIPRPNVKEPNININPRNGELFQNGYKVRPTEAWELPKQK